MKADEKKNETLASNDLIRVKLKALKLVIIRD